MADLDDEALREINSIDAARLALRGALATIRDLQEQNVRLKAELQDAAAQRKALDARIGDLGQQLLAWQRRAQEWEEAEKRRAGDEARLKNNLRIEVRAEERSRVEDYQRRMDEDLARLRAELERMAAGHRQKEEAWAQVKKALEEREAELLRSEREKADLASRYRHDCDMLAELREARDREISASLKELHLALEDKEREIGALRRESEELKRAGAAIEKDLELKLREREEKLLRDYRLKEQEVTERYSKRETELQASWAELENGLWKRAKDARDKLDAVAERQFEERARALADRQQEIERHLAQQQKRLEDDFLKRCAEAEARYAADERRLADGWISKEKGLLKRFEDELAREKSAIEESYHARRGALEAEHKQLADRLLEEHARQEAERVRQADDFIAQKSAELDSAHQEKISALLSEQRRIEADLRDKAVARMGELEKEAAAAREAFALEKTEWIARQQQEAKGAHEALLKQFEEHERRLEEKFRARDEELLRAHQALEAQYKAHKTELEQRHAERERDLDRQWAARESELVRRYEARLQEQRALLVKEADERIDAARAEIEKRLSESYAAREGQLRERYDSLLREAREAGIFAKDAAQSEAAASIKQIRAELQARLDEWRNRADRAASEGAKLKEELTRLEQQHRAALQELQETRRAWDAEKLAFEQQLRQREVEREKHHAELERRLQELWTKKEAAAVAARLEALQSQHAHYLEQVVRSEEAHRKAFEEWKRQAEAEMAAQKERWLLSRESDLAEKRRQIDAEVERRLKERRELPGGAAEPFVERDQGDL